MARKPATWLICMDTFDRLPREARRALAQSDTIGTARAADGLRIARAPGAVMAARILMADALLAYGDNISKPRPRKVSRDQINAILCGDAACE